MKGGPAFEEIRMGTDPVIKLMGRGEERGERREEERRREEREDGCRSMESEES